MPKSATGARWSMGAGFIGFIAAKALVGFGVAPFSSLLINFLDPFFIGLYASLLFAVIGSVRHPITEAETTYREMLLVLPQSERVSSDYRIDRVYGWVLVAAGVGTTLFLLFGWALPYNGLI